MVRAQARMQGFAIFLLLIATSAYAASGDPSEYGSRACHSHVVEMVAEEADLDPCETDDKGDDQARSDGDEDPAGEGKDPKPTDQGTDDPDDEDDGTDGGSDDPPLIGDEVTEALQPVVDTVDSAPLTLEWLLWEVQRTAATVQPTIDDLLAGEAPAEEEAPYEPSSMQAATAGPGAVAIALMATATAASIALIWFAGSSSVAGSAAAKGSAEGMRRLPLVMPLFTRFEKTTVLEHPNRATLYMVIHERPGVRLQDLCDASGLSRTAVTHHLRLLEQQHIVVSRRVGRSRHYYENGGRYERDQKAAYAVLQNDRSRTIAQFIRDHPGMIQKQLCEALELRASIAHWHIKRLEEASLVDADRQGRTVTYYPAEAMQAVTL